MSSQQHKRQKIDKFPLEINNKPLRKKPNLNQGTFIMWVQFNVLEFKCLTNTNNDLSFHSEGMESM